MAVSKKQGVVFFPEVLCALLYVFYGILK